MTNNSLYLIIFDCLRLWFPKRSGIKQLNIETLKILEAISPYNNPLTREAIIQVFVSMFLRMVNVPLVINYPESLIRLEIAYNSNYAFVIELCLRCEIRLVDYVKPWAYCSVPSITKVCCTSKLIKLARSARAATTKETRSHECDYGLNACEKKGTRYSYTTKREYTMCTNVRFKSFFMLIYQWMYHEGRRRGNRHRDVF